MSKVVIIAEAGVNHNGDLKIAVDLIHAAAAAKADYVKFQTFKAGKLVTMDAVKAEYQIQNTNKRETQFEMLRRLELSEEAHFYLKKECEKSGIKFLSTAFDDESADFLNRLGIDFFKIPSGELTNYFLIKKIASFGKPVVISTGMSNLEDIEAAIHVLIEGGLKMEDISVLHCNTQYPTPYADVNLLAMKTINDKFKVRIGYSDHTLGTEIPVAAVAMGATIVEKHFTLSRKMEGPDHAASLEPHELSAMVSQIRNVEFAVGTGLKAPSQSELGNMTVARKSLVLAHDLQKGHTLEEKDLTAKRPGTGLSPFMFPVIQGRKLKSDLKQDHQLSLDDLE